MCVSADGRRVTAKAPRPPPPERWKASARAFQTPSYAAAAARASSVFEYLGHDIIFHFISLHFISYHIISYHIISYHIISFHFISLHFI